MQKEDDWYIAKYIENGVASQGKTIDCAISNLKEAMHLYYENTERNVNELYRLIDEGLHDIEVGNVRDYSEAMKEIRQSSTHITCMPRDR